MSVSELLQDKENNTIVRPKCVTKLKVTESKD